VALIRIPVVNVRQQNPIRFFDEQGQLRELPHLRLRLFILLGKEAPLPAILDTGATISVFPRRVWQRHPAEINRVRVPEGTLLRGASGGRRYGYFLGRVWVGAIDLWGRRLPAVPVLAQFREDDIPQSVTIPAFRLTMHFELNQQAANPLLFQPVWPLSSGDTLVVGLAGPRNADAIPKLLRGM
jgi:hypothetical protein